MPGLLGVWDWSNREPSRVERAVVAIVVMVLSLACTVTLAIGVSRLMRLLPAE